MTVKPDMTRQEREAESLLMKARWKLISEGTDRKLIKIRHDAIYVGTHKHAVINGFKFVPCGI